jgi:hypothetical protein
MAALVTIAAMGASTMPIRQMSDHNPMAPV